MNYCKEITIHIKDKKVWIDYEHKSTTTRYECSGMREATQLANSLYFNVDEWVDDEKEGGEHEA